MANTPFRTLYKTGGNPLIFRARGARIYSAVGYFFSLGMFFTVFADPQYSSTENLAFGLLVLFLIFSIYIGIQKPALLFTDVGIGVRNPFSVRVFDWNSIKEIETKFVLTLQSENESVRCWAASGPSRSQHRAIHPSELRGFHQKSGVGNGVRAADSPRADSGAAAFIARDRIANRSAHETKVADFCDSHSILRASYLVLALAVVVSHIFF